MFLQEEVKFTAIPSKGVKKIQRADAAKKFEGFDQ